MPVDVVAERSISRPRPAVAAIMFDPARDAEWTGGVIASRPHAPGLLAPQSRVDRQVRFLGRTFWYTYEVVGTEPARWVEMRVTDPFPMTVRYEISDIAGGATVRIRAQGDARGFFRYVGPLLSWMVRRNIRRDLDALKRVVEREDGTPRR